MPSHFYLVFIRLPFFVRALLTALLSITIFGIFIHLIEPKNFPTVLDGIWWAVITASTVGYGDYVPHSVIGKLTGMLLILTSAGFVSSFFVALATASAARQNDYLEGKIDFKDEGHLIIIGWNERSREIIYSLINQKSPMLIALIDETLKQNPVTNKNVHFIQGRPNQDEILIKANIKTAKKVIITADPTKNELEADMKTILTLLAIKGLNPHIETIVEILTNEQIANANRAGADEIIQTNILTSFVMFQSITTQDIVTSFLELLYQMTEEKILFQPVHPEELEMDFTILGSQFLHEGKVLLGVKRGEATILNPPRPFMIEKHDELILIT